MVEDLRDQGVTVLLVTHFMEEAERLCDRVAVIDNGRVVAIGSPAALTERLGGERRATFRPSAPFDDRVLLDLPEVATVTRRGDLVAVTGTGDVLGAVTSTLAAKGVAARQLQVDQSNLEDVFVTLTSHTGNPVEPEPR